MARKILYEDEELLQKLKEYSDITDLRKRNISLYQLCRTRNLIPLQRNMTGEIKPERKAELIEWISKFNNRTDLRIDNYYNYNECLKWGLKDYFPPKVDRFGKPIDEEAVAEKKRLREKKKEEKKEKEKKKKKPISDYEIEDKTKPSQIYKGVKLDNGNIICGRCLLERPYGKTGTICKKCYNTYYRYKYHNKDHNKWNVRDEFCNIKINHHEKVFEIGIKVDERTQNYLTMVGYGFIFKEPYDE